MPELLAASVPGRLQRMTWPLVCVLPLCGIPAGAFAQSAADAALRACAAEKDSARRLSCYDREMGRLPAAPAGQPAKAMPSQSVASPSSAAAAGVSVSAPAPTSSSAPAQASRPLPAQASSAAPGPASGAVAASAGAAEPGGRDAAAPHQAWPWKLLGSGKPWQVTAHVTQLKRWPDAMVLRLDNGQVWRQIGRASGDLSLREGDSVTIEKHLGSYWLSSRYVSNMQVRLDPQQAP
jgi:hypothetical protein